MFQAHGFKEKQSEFTSFNFELVIHNFESLSLSSIHKPFLHPFPCLTKVKTDPFGIASTIKAKPNSTLQSEKTQLHQPGKWHDHPMPISTTVPPLECVISLVLIRVLDVCWLGFFLPLRHASYLVTEQRFQLSLAYPSTFTNHSFIPFYPNSVFRFVQATLFNHDFNKHVFWRKVWSSDDTKRALG